MSSWRHTSEPAVGGDRRVALVVAGGERDNSFRRSGPSAGRVVHDLHDVLAAPTLGGFDVHVALDQPVHQVRLVVDDIASTCAAGDLLLVVVLCPGLRDSRGRLVFATADTRPDRLASTGLEARWLFDQLDQSAAARQVVIIDCWLSDHPADIATWEPDLGAVDQGLGSPRSQVVLSALWSGGQSTGFDPGTATGAVEPAFTDALVAGIRSGTADADRDGMVSVDEAYAYALDRLRSHGVAVKPQRRTYGPVEEMLLAYTNPLALDGDAHRDGPSYGWGAANRAADNLGTAIDENVQFTVYRPRSMRPAVWYPFLAFAHLSERRSDAPPEEPDPIDQVKALAAQALGAHALAFSGPTSDARAGVPRSGELTLVPTIEGVTFNPTRRSFSWVEDVHKEEFRLRADVSRSGSVVRGRLTVYLGFFILADVDLAIRIDAAAPPPPAASLTTLLSSPDHDADPALALEPVHGAPYRKIFLSYSHLDTEVVEQAERLGRALGDTYLRDRTTLLAGEKWHPRLLELIDEADVFQLFWSRNSMSSDYVRQEWEHALTVDKPSFIRPTYWEVPMPSSDVPELPPPALKALHFHALFDRPGTKACPECGADNPPGAAFCLVCNAFLEFDESPRSAIPTGPLPGESSLDPTSTGGSGQTPTAAPVGPTPDLRPPDGHIPPLPVRDVPVAIQAPQTPSTPQARRLGPADGDPGPSRGSSCLLMVGVVVLVVLTVLAVWALVNF